MNLQEIGIVLAHLEGHVITVCIIKQKVKVKSLSCVRLFATPWTVVYQAPLSMGFSRQRYWSGLPFPPPGDLPNLEIKPGSPTLQAGTLPSEPLWWHGPSLSLGSLKRWR